MPVSAFLALTLFAAAYSMLTLNITQYAFSVRDFSVFIFCSFDDWMIITLILTLKSE